jgi:hypothetical protein
MHVPPKLTLDNLAKNQLRDIIDIIDATEKQNNMKFIYIH